MQNKQLPLFLILLMMVLVACGGGSDSEGVTSESLDLPLIATSDETSEDVVMEEDSAEMDDDSTEESEESAMEADSAEAEPATEEAEPTPEEMEAEEEATSEPEPTEEAMDADADADASEADSMDADDSDDADDTDDEADESDDSDEDAATDEESAEEAVDESAAPSVIEDLSGTTVYVVQDGDSLSVIAETFGVGSAAVMAANDIENADQIYVGQPLIIPGEGESAEAASDDSEQESEEATEADEATLADNEGEYTVLAGDTLSQLAEALEIPSRAIAAKNGISDQDGLFTGQVLLIPAADEIDALLEAPLPEPIIQPGIYVVQPGDSLAGIAIALEISLVDLASANNIVDYDTIYVGQTLAIP